MSPSVKGSAEGRRGALAFGVFQALCESVSVPAEHPQQEFILPAHSCWSSWRVRNRPVPSSGCCRGEEVVCMEGA